MRKTKLLLATIAAIAGWGGAAGAQVQATPEMIRFYTSEWTGERFGNTENRARPYTDLRLESGDLFVFGGASRFAFHGVPKIYPGTAEPATGLASGRLNITLRVTGLAD